MRMTLSSHNMSNDNRSNSPNSSPRSSPRPSPKPQAKREHASRTDTYLSSSYKEGMSLQKHDASPTAPGGEGNHSSGRSSVNELVPPIELNRSESTSGKEKKEGRTKKKSAWYSVLYPTYKSRSEDFRQTFKDVPDDERLVVDYSCAMQKEILVQGRLYVSQNYLCFHANIFGWETNVSTKWKDVTAITKEKTALVIPNAVLVSTKTDKYFFASLVARDKTYMMLFRVWQNALMERLMNQQEMWQLVHDSYGAELGLTSDDEDYIAPGTEEDKLSTRVSSEYCSEECASVTASNADAFNTDDNNKQQELEDMSPLRSKHKSNGHHDNNSSSPPAQDDYKSKSKQAEQTLPTDMSDTTDSDREKNKTVNTLSPSPRCSSHEHNNSPTSNSSPDNKTDPDPNRSSSDEKLYPVCTVLHEGRKFMNEVIPMHADQVFTLIFTNSQFFLDFHASRKTTDLTQTTWTHDPATNVKTRVLKLTIALNATMGPKTANVTETHNMLPCSKPGYLYSIDVHTQNAGIPYADSFNVTAHYCIHRVSDTQCNLAVFGQIKYLKSVWGLVRGMIEKNCYMGMDDYFGSLSKALSIEAEERMITTVKRKSRRKRRQHSIHRPSSEEVLPARASLTRTKATSTRKLLHSNFNSIIISGVLVLLVVLNISLYYKLWSLEATPPYSILDLHVLKEPPKSHDEWIKLLQKQETLHTVEMHKWQKILNTAIKLLKQTEESLNELQNSIHPTYTNKIMSSIENQEGAGGEPIAPAVTTD